MKKPRLQDDAFLEDVAAARLETDRLHFWWLGQSGFLVQWERHHLLFDPYLSDSLTRKYAGTDKPHVRMTGRVVAPDRLGFVDLVTSSHNHTDHLDPETLQPLARANPSLAMVCPEANRATVLDRSQLPDERVHGLDAATPSMPPWDPAAAVSVAGFGFHAVPAAHEGLDTDAQGRHIYLGFVVRVGPLTIYHSGDTVLYPGMVERLRPFAVDIALLPINGRAPERRVAGNLRGREAAWLAKETGARLVVPCHYDLFEFNTATPDDFVRECERFEQPYRVLEQGERSGLAPRQ